MRMPFHTNDRADRASYLMRAVDVTTPTVDTDGNPNDVVNRFTEALLEAGYTGWTRHASVGAWQGLEEPGWVWTFYLPNVGWTQNATQLGQLARKVMPDQDAVQVVDHGTVHLAEY